MFGAEVLYHPQLTFTVRPDDDDSRASSFEPSSLIPAVLCSDTRAMTDSTDLILSLRTANASKSDQRGFDMYGDESCQYLTLL